MAGWLRSNYVCTCSVYDVIRISALHSFRHISITQIRLCCECSDFIRLRFYSAPFQAFSFLTFNQRLYTEVDTSSISHIHNTITFMFKNYLFISPLERGELIIYNFLYHIFLVFNKSPIISSP
jgi:hypothetical protein